MQHSLSRPLEPTERPFWFASLAEPLDPAPHLHRLLEFDRSFSAAEVRKRIFAAAKNIPLMRRGIVLGDDGVTPWVFEDAGSNENWLTEEGAFSDAAVSACVRIPFDLSEPPLVRIHIFRSADLTQLLMVAHHVLIDGLTFDRLTSDFVRALILDDYSASLTSVSLHGGLVWKQAQHEAWAHLLDPPAHLRDVRAETSELSEPCRITSLPGSTVQAVEQLREVTGRSTAAILLAVWTATIHRVLDLTDVVVATQIDARGRHHRTSNGMFVNTVPIRSQLVQHQSWTEFLDSIQSQVVHTVRHRFQPFEEILALTRPERRPDQSTVLTDFEFSSLPRWKVPDEIESTGIEVREVLLPDPGTRFGISLNVVEGDNEISLRWAARPEHYSDGDLDLIQSVFDRMLLDLTRTASGESLGPTNIDIVSEVQRRQICDLGQGRVAPIDSECVTTRFREIATEQPRTTAVVTSLAQRSYLELSRMAESVSRLLSEAGVLAGDRVLVCCERGFAHIAALLAIINSGAVYTPCDPTNPKARIQQMCDAVRPVVAVHDASTAEKVERACPNLGMIDLALVPLANSGLRPASTVASATHPTYIVFTSGSTGVPKAVEVGREAFNNHIQMIEEDLALGPSSVVAQTAATSFDIHIWQCLSALLVGGRICVYGTEELQDPQLFLEKLIRHETTVLELVPSYLRVAIRALAEARESSGADLRLTSLIPTGESLDRELALQLLELFPNADLVNAYGPAEAADDVTLHSLTANQLDGPVPIGWPARNVQMYVVDNWQRLRPLGRSGEIVISGPVLANGYVSGPPTGGFVSDSGSGNERVYRTGDIATLSVTKGFTFIGRRDHQVKIAGRRVELGDVEEALRRLPNVVEGVVTICDNGGRTEMDAYVVLDGPGSPQSLRQELRQVLPTSMIPARIRLLGRMPTTPSGKIDRNALDQVDDLEDLHRQPLIADRVSRIVGNAWNTALQLRSAYSHSDLFFELGGDSLAAMDLITGLRASGFSVAIRDLYENQSLSEFTEVVRASEHRSSEEWAVKPWAYASPRIAEFLDRVDAGARVPVQALIFEGVVAPDALLRRIGEIVDRHPALSFRFELADGRWRALKGSAGSSPTETTAAHIPEDKPEHEADHELRLIEAAAAQLDIGSGRHTAVSWDSSERVCLVVSHLVCDLLGLRQIHADLIVALARPASTNLLRIPASQDHFMSWLDELDRRAHLPKPNAMDVYRDEVHLCTKELTAPLIAVEANVDRWSSGPFGTRLAVVRKDLSGPFEASELLCLATSTVAQALRECLPTTERLRIDLDSDGRRAFERQSVPGDGLGCFTLLTPLPIRIPSCRGSVATTIDAVTRSLSMAETSWVWDTCHPPPDEESDLLLVPLLNIVGSAGRLTAAKANRPGRIPTSVVSWNASADPHGLVIDLSATTDHRGFLRSLEFRITSPGHDHSFPLDPMPELIAIEFDKVVSALTNRVTTPFLAGLDIAGVALADLDPLLAPIATERGGSAT